MIEWANRPLDRVYPVIFIGAIHVRVRGGQVSNRPIYVAIGVTVNGERDILSLWVGHGGRGREVLARGAYRDRDRGVCIAVCDGLRGLYGTITTALELAVVQTCVIHLIRNTFHYASHRSRDEMSKDLRPVYTAPTEAAAKERFVEFAGKWGQQYSAIVRLWENAWSVFVPFLGYDVETRRVICSTKAVESSMPATAATSAPAGTSRPSSLP